MIAAVDIGRVVVGLVTAAAAVMLTRSWIVEWRRNRPVVVPFKQRSHVVEIERPAAEHVVPPSGRSPIGGSGRVDGSLDPSTHIAGGDQWDLALHRVDAARRAARDWHPSTMDSAR